MADGFRDDRIVPSPGLRLTPKATLSRKGERVWSMDDRSRDRVGPRFTKRSPDPSTLRGFACAKHLRVRAFCRPPR
jgi:hypothetical protein